MLLKRLFKASSVNLFHIERESNVFTDILSLMWMDQLLCDAVNIREQSEGPSQWDCIKMKFLLMNMEQAPFDAKTAR